LDSYPASSQERMMRRALVGETRLRKAYGAAKLNGVD
jgi:hypothetical protein